MTAPSLAALLSGRAVVCCVGPGGVGKTTSSAALGLWAAVHGRKVLVLTIDPARRLANSLGLSELGNRESRIDLSPLAPRGVHAKGELWAMMLDLKLSWDDLVRRAAPSEAQAQRILGNRLYQSLSTAMAGSLEYIAMEKLQELSRSGRYDLIVLDTPPTANALDFLHAPDRILDVLNNDAIRLVMSPMLKAGKLGLRLFSLGSSVVLKTLARFTGGSFLVDLSEFLSAFEGMYDDFKRRAADVKALLKSPQAAFVLVTSPNALSTREVLFFHQALAGDGIHTAAVIANRIDRDPHRRGGATSLADLREALADAQVADLAGEGGTALSERLFRTIAEQTALAHLDARCVDDLASALPGVPLFRIHRRRRDVHDLASLWQIDEELTRPEE